MDKVDISDILKQNKSGKRDEVLSSLEYLKNNAILLRKEKIANEIYILREICLIQNLFEDAFEMLKQKRYFNAWGNYANIDIKLAYFRKHKRYYNEKYRLKFIEEYSRKFMKLFPYEYFMSRTGKIKNRVCSVCKKKVSLRNHCSHVPGELYMGEKCVREITDYQLINIAIVKDPFDKYTTLFPSKLKYNYEIIDTLIKELDNTYSSWELIVSSMKKKEYYKLGRNDICVCGSGKKYKKCCKGSEEELMRHYQINLSKKYAGEKIKNKIVGTWR